MKARKTISLLLSVIIILSSFSLCSFAAGKYRYVVLGDSIAYGSGLVNATETCYGRLVADTCGFDYANHAVPGDTTGQLIGVLDKINVRSDLARADIISISIGGNDFLDELSDLMFDAIVRKDYTDFDRIGFGVYTNVSKVIELIRELNGDAVILLQTLYNPQFGYLKEAYQHGADYVNEAIYRCAEENKGVEVVDVAAAVNGDESNFADDTLHPSARGNELIAKAVLAKLRELGFTKKTNLDAKVPGVDVVLGPAASQVLEFYAFFLHALAKALGAITVIMK